jgi:hypothetical protein
MYASDAALSPLASCSDDTLYGTPRGAYRATATVVRLLSAGGALLSFR